MTSTRVVAKDPRLSPSTTTSAPPRVTSSASDDTLSMVGGVRRGHDVDQAALVGTAHRASAPPHAARSIDVETSDSQHVAFDSCPPTATRH